MKSIADIPNIDAPIVDVLARMNGLGYRTRFSCCGYDYDRQGTRDHTSAYIIFECSTAALHRLLAVFPRHWSLMRVKTGWRIEYENYYASSRETDTVHGISERYWEMYGRAARRLAWPALKRSLDELMGALK